MLGEYLTEKTLMTRNARTRKVNMPILYGPNSLNQQAIISVTITTITVSINVSYLYAPFRKIRQGSFKPLKDSKDGKDVYDDNT